MYRIPNLPRKKGQIWGGAGKGRRNVTNKENAAYTTWPDRKLL